MNCKEFFCLGGLSCPYLPKVHTPLGEAWLAPQTGRVNGHSALHPAQAHGRDKAHSLAATRVQDSTSTQGRTVAMIQKISWPMENLESLTTSWSLQAGWDQFPQSSWTVFFNRKAKLISIFAKLLNWKRKKHQFYRLFIQICSSLKSTYYLQALRWVTSVLLCLESEQIEEPNLFQSNGEQAVTKEIA